MSSCGGMTYRAPYASMLPENVPVHPPRKSLVYVVEWLSSGVMYVGFTYNMRYASMCTTTVDVHAIAVHWIDIMCLSLRVSNQGGPGCTKQRSLRGRVQHSRGPRHVLNNMGLLLRPLIDVLWVRMDWNVYTVVFNVPPRHTAAI